MSGRLYLISLRLINPDFGFGHSLLRNEKSQILQSWENSKNISDYLGFSSSLWNYPSLNDKFSFKDGTLTIGQQEYKWPLFGSADKNKNIKNIYFEAFALNAQKVTAEDNILFYINDCSITSNSKKGLCGYELTRNSTVQYQINETGLFNRREINVASPLFTEKLIGISSGPLNVQTGINDYIQEQTMPYGVNFYKLEEKNKKIKLLANFNTCNNVPVDRLC